MATYRIRGGRKLSGSVRPSGNKNEALPAITAALLSKEPVVLKNLPPINDAQTMLDIIAGLGASVDWIDQSTVRIHAKDLHSTSPDPKRCNMVRGSILLLGPLLARMKRISLALPGGDVIGARRIDTHIEGLVHLGAELELRDGILEGQIKQAAASEKEIYFDEPSVTATENLVMFAAARQGRVVIHNAACEPHVVGLCRMLVAMGAVINGIGSNRLEIRGTAELKGTEHRITADFMEVGSFVCMAAAVGGDTITIEDVHPHDYLYISKTWTRLGIQFKFQDQKLLVYPKADLAIQNEISGRVPTIYSGPWPAFPTDLMSVAITAATQARGTVLFFEKMFEGRMFFVDKLLSMGATAILCDPHRVVISGPSKLFPAKLNSPDVRAGMALIIAALIAEGTSEIANVYQIERGYFDVVNKLKKLGADIERVE